jgi:ankyrin repeat protein
MPTPGPALSNSAFHLVVIETSTREESAFKGETEVNGRLLRERCDVDTVNGAGKTTLMMGALLGQTDIGKLLIDHGANPRLKNAAGNTALGLARQSRDGHPAG